MVGKCRDKTECTFSRQNGDLIFFLKKRDLPQTKTRRFSVQANDNIFFFKKLQQTTGRSLVTTCRSLSPQKTQPKTQNIAHTSPFFLNSLSRLCSTVHSVPSLPACNSPPLSAHHGGKIVSLLNCFFQVSLFC